MSIAQIYAIIALLVAFNVPQATVSQVQGILQQGQSPVGQVVTLPAPQPQTPNSGDVGGSVAAPEALVPTSITADQQFGQWGGGCSAFGFLIKVYDQNGNQILPVPIVFTNPDTGETSTTTQQAVFFTPQKVSGIYNLTFSSGNASVTIPVNVKSIADASPTVFRKDSTDMLTVASTGQRYNSQTNTCN